MGVNFVISVENVNNRTQEEVNRKFGVSTYSEDKFPEWELFKYQGKHYAAWLSTPRYFQMEENIERWEALRKYTDPFLVFIGMNYAFTI